jgi:hypothetical protein
MKDHLTRVRQAVEERLGFDEAVKRRIDYAVCWASPDSSPEDYTAGCLALIEAIKQLYAWGEVKAAIGVGIALGQLLSEREIIPSRIWRSGVRHHIAGRSAAQATWGTPFERAARKQRLLDLFEEAMSNGAKSQEEAYRIAAKKGGASPRSIRRIVTGH